MKMTILTIAVLGAMTVLAGCATKHYGRQGGLTSVERDTMTCREIELDIAKLDGFLEHIEADNKVIDERQVLAFLGDFGVGNRLEREAAVKSAEDRKAQLRALQASKQCVQRPAA